MKPAMTLSIPKPCGEDWNNFTAAENGRFCSSCEKTVIDFTKMSDQQLLDYLQNKSAYMCGRFRADQLKTYSIKEQAKLNPGLTLLKAGVVGLLLALVSRQANAQVREAVTKTEIVDQRSVAKTTVVSDPITVKGVVKSQETQEVMPGINVLLKNTTTGTVTNANGEFTFPTKLKEGDVLIFTFIGYKPFEYTVTQDTASEFSLALDIALNEEIVYMGKVAIDEPYAEPKSSSRKLWEKVKSIF